MNTNITVQKVVVGNLFEDAQWPMFNQKKVAAFLQGDIPKLGALSIECHKRELPRDMEVLEDICASELNFLLHKNPRLPILPPNIWLFIAHDTWQPESAIILHNKLWKSLPVDLHLHQFEQQTEILVKSTAGIRFAGVVKVTSSSLRPAVRVLGKFRAAALILSSRPDVALPELVRTMYDAAFPNPAQTSIDWPVLAAIVCPTGDVVVRQSGSFDERLLALDLFMLSEKLEYFTDTSTPSER